MNTKCLRCGAASNSAASNLEQLEKRLGYRFANRSLLERALTHTSWANEAKKTDWHNERLEFLGDAVLELCVSEELFRRFPDAREGELTRLRSRLVSSASLANLARSLGLDQEIRLGVGEEKQGGRQRESILSDAFEAVLAAIYEDGGFSEARKAAARIFAPCWPLEAGVPPAQDYKTRLQEATQRLFRASPVYVLENTSGPEHAKMFNVCVRLPDGSVFRACNSSCKKAEQDAAASALEALEEKFA